MNLKMKTKKDLARSQGREDGGETVFTKEKEALRRRYVGKERN